ncbi:MAG: hypothetical protein E6G23_09800 [Actinobacteria bacterium]|nr:MAG: hypothetical protein E6G23_09800 [Actinomycetota bacterium]TMM21121.1 MAG: hypothetical protein E6F94_14060 [Actinomycetota bacterium]
MATRSYDVGRVDTQEYDVAGGGWITFAAIMLGLVGTFNVLEGILAIANSRVYTANQTFVFSDLNTWGWIVLFLGVFQLIAAFSLFGGSEMARWFGVFVAGVNAIGQLYYVPAFPIWSLLMFSVDVLIIYGLVAYAGHRLRES